MIANNCANVNRTRFYLDEITHVQRSSHNIPTEFLVLYNLFEALRFGEQNDDLYIERCRIMNKEERQIHRAMKQFFERLLKAQLTIDLGKLNICSQETMAAKFCPIYLPLRL